MTLEEKIEAAIKEYNAVHGVHGPAESLCKSCKSEPPICNADKIVWSIDRDPSLRGKAADTVLECDAYQKADRR